MPRDIVSEQQCNIEFVKTVEKYPCLYNSELPAYSRKDITDNAWEEVAEASNMTPSACRERWRNLRAVFIRNIKHMGSGAKKKPYYLAEVMQFVVPFIRPTNTTETEKPKSQEIPRSEIRDNGPVRPSLEIELGEVKVESVDDDTGQDWCVENMRKRALDSEDGYPNANKRPAVARSSIAVPENDPVTSFLHSLLPELKEMNSAQFKAFKRRVFALIDDITSEIPTTYDGEY